MEQTWYPLYTCTYVHQLVNYRDSRSDKHSHTAVDRWGSATVSRSGTTKEKFETRNRGWTESQPNCGPILSQSTTICHDSVHYYYVHYTTWTA